jgi:exo-beta-1,3-glucanase (GH17 family)
MRPVMLFLIGCLSLVGCSGGSDSTGDSQTPFTIRAFDPVSGSRWIGNAVSYGPHRDGQRPGGPDPSAAEISQDLQLMLPHWNLLRVYSSRGPTETLLELIRRDGLDMKVMLGVWIAAEEKRDDTGAVLERFPENVTANQQELEKAIVLAEQYPDIIVAVCVGNETQVYWSAHRSPLDILIGHVRQIRARVSQPVTVADDYNFWNKPESRELAAELDFITMHAHPMWNGKQLDEALAWTAGQVQAIGEFHPDRLVVLGETGWATQVHDEGEQARLITGRFGEAEQKVFHDQARAWADSTRTVVFYFEAFDENWKGGPHPDEVEKHWGVYRADRTAKAALAGP